MKHLRITLAAYLLEAALCFGDSIAVPPVQVPFRTVGSGVFLLSRKDVSSVRMQQVFGGQLFSSAGSPSLQISEVSFARAPDASPPIDVTLPNIDIRLSMTARTPDHLSQTFAENVGADEVVVYSGSLHLFDTGNEEYGLHIIFQHPFTYTPAMGNLLLDVRNYSTVLANPAGDYYIKAQVSTFDVSSIVGADNVNAQTGTTDTYAFMTRFDFAAVPEPASTMLLALGTAFWVCRRRVSHAAARRNRGAI